MGAMKETLGFQTEVRQLLQLMIHSLYSNREIFLRELISNASDACDKLRFEAIDRPDLYESDPDLEIDVEFDKAARTITVSDNGVGLSRQEAIDNLGTIARSGTREFFASLTGDQSRDANLIGQFGVGFYSSFIVADRVTVLTRRAGLPPGEAVRWESDGSGEFSIETIERPERGTSVTLHLRSAPPEGSNDSGGTDFDDLLSGWRLRSILRKYSDHISLPIRMRKESWNADKGEQVAGDEWETVNQASALWARPRGEIGDDDYKAFYQHLTADPEAPLAWTHNRVEGRTEYTQLLFVPARAPFDLFDRQNRRGIRLYVRRVFIMDDAEQLMPAYLRFVRGIVDSADLPLNVSREILQESRDVRAIREGCTKRVLAMLEELAADQPEQYAKFWQEFGQVLKEGTGEDHANQQRIAALLRFASTGTAPGEQSVSLADYIGRMKPGQDKIYYVTGEAEAGARNSPHLEVFRKKDVEVLLLTERVDEWMLSFLTEFDGKALASVARGGLDLGALQDADEKRRAEETGKEYAELLGRIRAALGDRVKDVRVTHRLTDSPSCLVSDEGDISGNLERLLKQAGQRAPERKPIPETNPDHPLVTRLRTEQGDFAAWSQLLFDQALLAEGGQLEDAAGFVKRLNDMLLSMTLRT
jgi:molecular chaperone HtpG